MAARLRSQPRSPLRRAKDKPEWCSALRASAISPSSWLRVPQCVVMRPATAKQRAAVCIAPQAMLPASQERQRLSKGRAYHQLVRALRRGTRFRVGARMPVSTSRDASSTAMLIVKYIRLTFFTARSKRERGISSARSARESTYQLERSCSLTRPTIDAWARVVRFQIRGLFQ